MEKKAKEYNRYTVLDAFKCFFWLLVVTALVSIVFQIVLVVYAKVNGLVYAELIKTETVAVISCVLSPVSMLILFFVYNGIRRVKNREAVTDGEKVSLLPISIAIVLAIICIFLFTPFMNLITILFQSSGYKVDNTLPMQDLMAGDIKYFLLGLLVYALLPAIAEELIFRGIIQTSLSTRYKNFVTMMVTTLLFVLMHGSLNQTFYQFIVGFMLSFLALVGGSVVYSIILHFLNNALVVVFSCFDIVSYLSINEAVYYNIFSMIFPFTIFLLGLALVAILFWVLKYLRNKNFFRLDEHGKFVTIDKEAVEKINASKTGFKGFFSSMNYNEKLYSVVGLIIIVIIWVSNTISGFM
ncbi:MAG: CPBP family intramembrane metalloprotease [Clostridiales bacterium]|nr:CPBP family intramembrane metalloprotease [Clostridiales bacterium]